MSPKFSKRAVAQPTRLVLCTALALALTACGGGGGSAGVVPGGSNATNPAAAEPKASITILSGSTPITSLAGGQSATVKVTILNGAGQAAANEVVTFKAGGLVAFNPSSASALTDAAGVAVITITPASAESAGATTIEATATVGGKTATARTNLSVGASQLAIGSLSFTGGAPAKLPAFSSLQLNIPISNNGQPSSTATGLTLTSLCVADKTATLVLGALTNGTQSATYTNNGCARGTDTITAQIGSSMQTIAVGVDMANIGAIQFVSSDAQDSSIVIKGSGGVGRAESALLTFRVLDQNNQGLAGVDVDFTASTYTGGLVVSPTRATTDANGNVTTTVTSGTIPTPVRVFAQAVRNGKTISGLSDTLTISTGLPVQKSMSLSASKYNFEGLNFDGETTDITVRLADQYGNPISDGTAVSFVAEGGAVGTSDRGACVTSGGGCTVPLSSQEFRPVNGRVTVLAYVQGIENFVDSNGDGQYSCTNFTAPDGSVPATYRPLVDTCVSGGEPFTDQGDPFLDAGYLSSVFGLQNQGQFNTLDGTYTAANGDLPIPYNSTTYRSAGNGRWGLNYIWRQAEFVFSGSYARMVRYVCGTTCADSTESPTLQQRVTTTTATGCKAVSVAIRLFDVNNNPLPVGSSVAIVDASKVTVSAVAPAAVQSSAAVGGTIHSFTVTPDATCSAGSFGVKVTTPKGIATTFGFTTN